ncbi:PREDICTED: protein phosphatase 1 regulatory subunit 3D-like [Acanthisitta chloris]|uniref:protein phosphatase 1 regulatory subunit 3D-like n=1 Tax=Acanthisitta chloris TaxID=57068 RepID=UPI0004F0DC5B|nr:PREDICTED: protein phosphatase 1 regulatory subunit 3D-like [Acanthisitta chloris]
MEVRGPRRNPSYLSDLYQNMLRAQEAVARGQQQPPALQTSSSTTFRSITSAKESPQPDKLQSSSFSSCDPALRPIIRRRARSLPTSPERRKRAALQCQSRMNRVRFADALGLELTEVKVFQSGEDPSIPLHVLSRLSINSDLWYSNSNLEFTMQCLVPDFQQPADCVDFSSRLQEQLVCLERVTSSDLGLSGTIHVCNVAFEKRVSVRYTFNQWESLHEVCARWHRSIPEKNGQEQVDVFTFFLPVPPFLLQLSSLVQFAARYQVNGQEYWDNNRGKNYTLTCRTHPLKVPRECEESWIHFI